MKILVTGGAGFIGSHVAEYFSSKGDEVVAFDNLKRGEILGRRMSIEHNVQFVRSLNNVSFIKGDIRDFSLLREVCKDVDVIVHAAAQVAVTTSLKNPREDFEINVLGTFNVLEAARLNDCSIIYCSTNKVYGSNVNKIPLIEQEKRYKFADERFRNGIPEDFPTDMCELHTPYGCSKLAGDIYTQDYGHVYGLKTAVFRMSCIYGERQFGVEDQGWIAWFAIATLLNKPITIYGDGKQVRDVLYVKDLVKAFDLFLENNLRQEVFNIGGGPENTLSLLELLDLLEEITGVRSTVRYANWRLGDQKVYISDITRAKERLGWKIKIRPREGISKMIEGIRTEFDILRLHF